MIRLYFFILLLASSAHADPYAVPPASTTRAQLVASVTYLQCDTVLVNNPDGSQTAITKKCINRWKEGTVNKCVVFNPFDVFSKLADGQKHGMLELALGVGTLSTWNETEPVPVDADPWCLQ